MRIGRSTIFAGGGALAGFALGILCGCLIFKRKYGMYEAAVKKEYDRIRQENKELEEKLKHKYDPVGKPGSPVVTLDDRYSDYEKEQLMQIYRDTVDGADYGVPSVNADDEDEDPDILEALALSEDDDEDEHVVYDVTPDPRYPVPEPVNGIRPPYLISEDEFCDGGELNAKVYLTYFLGDGKLCDANGLVYIEDRIIGEGVVLAHAKTDILLHVRNERLGADYEVEYDERRYSEVFGSGNGSLKRRRRVEQLEWTEMLDIDDDLDPRD